VTTPARKRNDVQAISHRQERNPALGSSIDSHNAPRQFDE
jgi:hypothetical protein